MNTRNRKADSLDFRQAQQDLRAGLRQGLLDAAMRLLAEEGPSALTVRRVAECVNCSTMAIYTLFGGKEGLANELYLEGFARLKAALVEARQRKPDQQGLAPLLQLARVYRQYARRNPGYYMVMFGDAIAGFVPPPASRNQAWESLAVMIEACERAMEEGVLARGNPVAAARLLWAAMHGAVSLELKGYYLKSERAAELFDAAVDAVLRALQQPGKT